MRRVAAAVFAADPKILVVVGVVADVAIFVAFRHQLADGWSRLVDVYAALVGLVA